MNPLATYQARSFARFIANTPAVLFGLAFVAYLLLVGWRQRL